MRLEYFFLHVLLASLLLQYTAYGQVGVSICACQPSEYTFQFNFDSLCVNSTVADNDGINGVSCYQRGIGVNAIAINDTIPILIDTIDVIELDANQQTLSQTPYVYTYQNGDTFVYTSPITGTLDSVFNLSAIPNGLQMNLNGVNRFEQPITNVWLIVFDNDCNNYPVLNPGDSIGWTKLITVQKPFDGVCPLSANSNDAPTASPILLSTSNQPSILDTNCIPRPPTYGKGSMKTSPTYNRKSAKGSNSKGQTNQGKGGKYHVNMNDDLYHNDDTDEKSARGTANTPSSLPYCSSSKQSMTKKETTIKESGSSKKDVKLHKDTSTEHYILKSKRDDSDRSNNSHHHQHKKTLPTKYSKESTTTHSNGGSGKSTNGKDPTSSDDTIHVYSMKKAKGSNSHKKIHHPTSTTISHSKSKSTTNINSSKHNGSSNSSSTISTIPISTGTSPGVNSNNNIGNYPNAVKMTELNNRR